jgi:hypothetical protein
MVLSHMLIENDPKLKVSYTLSNIVSYLGRASEIRMNAEKRSNQERNVIRRTNLKVASGPWRRFFLIVTID